MKRYKKLTNESTVKSLFALAIPAVFMALLDEINGVIDAVFMGKYIGEEALSSMAIILPFFIFMSALGFLFAEGAGIALGRYLGSEQIKEANETMTTTIMVTIFSGIIMGVVSYFIYPFILDLYSLTDVVKMYAGMYIEIFSFGLPLIMLSIVLGKIVYTEGFASITLWLAVLQLVVNAISNYVVLAVLGGGVREIAIVTIVSMGLQSIVLYRVIMSKRMVLKISCKYIRLTKAYFREILPLGMPTFITMVLLAATLGIEGKVIADFGSTQLSVQTITGYMFSMSGSIASGIMSASLVLMSYSVGAKDLKRFYNILRLSLISVFTVSVLINLPLVVNSGMVANIFTKSEMLIELIHIPALIYGLTAPFIFTTNVFLYAMQPIGMEKTATVLFALQQVALFVPLLFVLRPFGFNFAISAQPVAEVIGGIITLILITTFFKTAKAYFNQEKSATTTAAVPF